MKKTGIKKINGEVVMSLIFVLFFAVIIIMSLGYPSQAALLPIVVSVPGLVLSIAVFITEIWKVKITGITESAKETHSEDNLAAKDQKVAQKVKREKIYLLWLIVALVIILVFGFFIGVAIFLPLYLRLQGKESWKVTILYTIFSWLTIYILFYRFLGIPLFEGFLSKYF